MCCCQLLSAGETNCTSSVTSHWELEIGQGGNIYTGEIGKCYKPILFSVSPCSSTPLGRGLCDSQVVASMCHN